MPQRDDGPPKRKASAFKPPISKKDLSTAHQRKPADARAKRPSHQLSSSEKGASLEDTNEDINPSPDVMVSVDIQDPSPTIPPKLLTRLLHHHFQNEKTRIGPEANALVGKYMETFIREALARAAFERSESSGGGMVGGFLEVSKETS